MRERYSSAFLLLLLIAMTLGIYAKVQFGNRCMEKADHFIAKYKLETSSALGFISRRFYQTKHSYFNGTDSLGAKSYVPACKHTVDIKKKQLKEKYRVLGSILIFHFYHGSSASCHQINPKTRKYTKTEIGFRTNNFICVIPPGNYFAFTINREYDAEYIFIGVSHMQLPGLKYITFYPKEEMMDLFPEHKDLIQSQDVV